MLRFPPLKKLFLVFFLLILLLLMAGIFWFSRVKSYGLVSPRRSLEETSPSRAPVADRVFAGKSVTFSYPGRFHEVQSTSPIEKPFLERFIALQEGSDSSQTLALVVQNLNGSTLSEYSSYAFRHLHPKTYTEEKIEVNHIPVTLFIKDTPVYEIGAFFEKKGRGGSLVISSPLGLSGAREELLTILSTFSWKE